MTAHAAALASVGLDDVGALPEVDEVLAALRMDKKYAGGVRFVLLESPGHPRVVEGIDEGDIRHAYRTVAA